jgi:7,8-dihydroneopterin aldolase/epimerase/oxygenase
MQFTIHLNDVKFYAYHGVYSQEKIIGNWFIVNLQVDYTIKPHKNIELIDTINYEKLFDIVNNKMQIATQLLENICIDIVDTIFANFNSVTQINITIAKQNPPIEGFVGNVAVQLLKNKM